MAIYSRLFKKLQWQVVAALASFFVTFFTLPVNAGEVSAQIHSGTEENAVGYSFVYSDNISTKRNFRWGVAYSYLDEMKAEWNGEETFFNNDTLELFAAYRHFPQTYNSFWRPFTFEVQAGASVSLTENKFIFENFPDQEIVFSEKNDINLMASFIAQYQLSKETQLQLGYKYYPDFSDFGSQSSVFIGITYQFGRKLGY